MKIEYSVKNVYGNSLNYPENNIAIMATKLSGRKTLSEDDLKILKDAGFELIRIAK